MTNRLYYNDPSLRAFDASVVSVEPRDERLVVTLDRTAFYPTSGGQPYDTGTLGGFRVGDVIDREDGSIAHLLELAPEGGPSAGRIPSPGDVLHGEIDWARRADHMQQHTGQHVLSAAFERLFQVHTVSFHLGADVSTIDLSRAVSDRELAAAEDEANQVVWEDRAVTIRDATPEEAARLPLRKEPTREGTLRLIEVADFDLSACGGTHVARTGAIGIIAVSSWERFKGGYRVEFLCGGRVLERFRAWRDTLGATVRLLSVSHADVADAVARLHADQKVQKRSVTALQAELARYRADELATTARNGLVLQSLDADANTLKALASAVAAKPGLTVVLVSRQEPLLLVAARSADAPGSAKQIVAHLIAQFGGRGGGTDELAQGGGLNGSAQAVLDRALQFCARPG